MTDQLQPEAFQKAKEPSLRRLEEAFQTGQPEAFEKLGRSTVTAGTMLMLLWPVSDTDLIDHLAQGEIDITQNWGSRIIAYYQKNDWEKLETMVQSWQDSFYVNDRFQILSDCFDTLKSTYNTDTNVANAIVPTLVCQLEGIVRDGGLLPRKGKVNGVPFDNHNAENHILAIIAEVFCGSEKFENAKKKGLNITNINRHKINHGDRAVLDYGSDESLIRLFLYINEAIRCLDNKNKAKL